MDIFPQLISLVLSVISDFMVFVEMPVRILLEENPNLVFGVDMSIESLRSQKFSKGIFVFLILSLVLFSVIIWLYLPKKHHKKVSKLKTGEKIMFGAIIAGIVLAIVIGWVQLIEGYLI